MTEAGFALEGPQIRVRRDQAARRALTGVLVWAVVLGNAGVIVWLWAHGGNVTDVHNRGELFNPRRHGDVHGRFSGWSSLRKTTAGFYVATIAMGVQRS